MNKILNHISKYFNLIMSFVNLALFFSIRMCWSGISKTLGYEKSESVLILYLPVILCGVFLILFIVNILLFKLKKDKNTWSYIMNTVNVVLFIVIIVIIALGAKDYMSYAWPYFFRYCLIAIGILAFSFIIFYYPKTFLKDNKIFKYTSLALVLLITTGYLTNANINYITYEPVVYIVEDEYQIVFSSNSESRAWVVIGDDDNPENYYYDNYQGYNKSYTKVHKISVPKTKLDETKEYTIHSQKITYRGPFGGFKGRDISETYSFKPINTDDGLNYYAISDIHMGTKPSVQSANHIQDKELLILAGDLESMLEFESNAQYANKIAYEITRGEIPVIYARGNHELKGKYYESFHNYVGAKGEDFFYCFTFGNVYGLVLDLGEDHDDDYWEYYDLAKFDEYRNKQLDFVKKELESKEYEKYDYRLVVSHIPVPYVNSRHNHKEFKHEMTSLLNQMDIDLMISGHQHELLVFEPDTVEVNKKLKFNTDYDESGKTIKAYLTDCNFPTLLVSKRGFTQTDSSKLTSQKSQIGLNVIVDFNNKTQDCIFINSKGDKVNIVNPFVQGLTYGDKITFSLETNKSIR